MICGLDECLKIVDSIQTKVRTKILSLIIDFTKFSLNFQKKFTFDLWLNADILPGIINPKTVPLSPHQFIETCQKFSSKVTLSLGFTTLYDETLKGHAEAKYNQVLIEKMIKILEKTNSFDRNVTFPLRAIFASKYKSFVRKLCIN